MKSKRSRQLADYYIKRKKFLEDNRMCEVCYDERRPSGSCSVGMNRACDVHHVKGRIGEMLLNENWWLAVCRDHHQMIHDNPAWAREMGYL